MLPGCLVVMCVESDLLLINFYSIEGSQGFVN